MSVNPPLGHAAAGPEATVVPNAITAALANIQFLIIFLPERIGSPVSVHNTLWG
jgi:hypothetical protein